MNWQIVCHRIIRTIAKLLLGLPLDLLWLLVSHCHKISHIGLLVVLEAVRILKQPIVQLILLVGLEVAENSDHGNVILDFLKVHNVDENFFIKEISAVSGRLLWKFAVLGLHLVVHVIFVNLKRLILNSHISDSSRLFQLWSTDGLELKVCRMSSLEETVHHRLGVLMQPISCGPTILITSGRRSLKRRLLLPERLIVLLVLNQIIVQRVKLDRLILAVGMCHKQLGISVLLE